MPLIIPIIFLAFAASLAFSIMLTLTAILAGLMIFLVLIALYLLNIVLVGLTFVLQDFLIPRMEISLRTKIPD